MRISRSADGVDGGDTAHQPHIPPPHPAPAPPPAASVVLSGTKTEREIELEAELEKTKSEKESEAAARKRAEMDAGQLQDEVHRIKSTWRREPKPETRSLRKIRATE